MTPLSRRGLLGGGLALGAGAALERVGKAGAADVPAAAPPAARHIPFDGARQAGVLTVQQRRAIFVAFDAIAASQADLAAALQALSDRARRLTQGYDVLLGEPGGEGPTPDSGILGPVIEPDDLTITIGFGASLFDDRYGLADRRPAGLRPMRVFPDDALVASETHGDVLVQMCAQTPETLLHALRDVMRATRGALAVRWKVEGFLPAAREGGAPRNMLGFKDGTANPDARDRALMDRLVWTREGGTHAVVRIIRNRVEFWDRVALSEQELMIGRAKGTGAPLGRRAETDDPDLRGDPDGVRIPLDSHIRLARPRTAATEGSRLLRRSYSYSRGVDESGQLDMGLVFACYQADVAKQFDTVQERLAGEPLVDYVVPTGGGAFYLPPGAVDAHDFVGSALVT